ncbi:hypothetical protein DFH28DRAFT_1218163 [Melampsora americana]|nr:hypothetical protein DFH28DRAFT_1218163 [Melampsora americana]
MPDQPPPTPNPPINSSNPPIESTNLPIELTNPLINSTNPPITSQNPPATPVKTTDVVWGLSQPISTPVPQLQLISTYPAQPHPFISSPSPLLFTYPASQSLQPTSSTPAGPLPIPSSTLESMAQPETKAKKTRGSRISKKTTKKLPKSTSASTSMTNDESSLDQDDSISIRKQLSWNKDTNSEGKTMLDLIVEWLGFTWGDQDLEGDVMWMCMESHDTESTNFTRYRMGIPKKKECAERCGKFLNANGFTGFTWAGVKQQIDSLETKFRGAEVWRNDTGGGVFMNSNAETEIKALHSSGQWTIDKEDDIRASTARTTKAILHSKCPYYNILLPVMGDRPSNEPLYAAESGIITPSTTKSHLGSARLSPCDEALATQYNGWDPSQSFDHTEESLPYTLDNILPNPEDRTRYSVSHQGPHLAQAQSQIEGRPGLHSNPTSNPPASQTSNQSTNNISRRTSSSSSFLKSIQTSLPSQSDIKEMNENNKSANENQRLMIEKVAGASEGMVNLLGARFGVDKSNDKRLLEDDDLTPEAVARRKAKKAKQDELELMKLDRELAQERKALEVHNRGAGMSKLELARERIDIITKLAAVNIPYAEAERMADSVIEGLQKDT